jgi:ectoine hydroxylase-related dioxygenase (phytanoyl-CoA dioxygenase family)
MFEPNDVATVWIALDDMFAELGPITYVKSSHRWGDGRIGSSQNFFQDNGGKSLLYSAAQREGIENVETSLEFESMAGMQAGGLSIHGE